MVVRPDRYKWVVWTREYGIQLEVDTYKECREYLYQRFVPRSSQFKTIRSGLHSVRSDIGMTYYVSTKLIAQREGVLKPGDDHDSTRSS